MLFVETPSNPVMRLTDLRGAAELAHRHDAAARRRQHVREPRAFSGRSTLGADLVIHSTTKYLNGHSDSVGGVVVATRDEDIEWLKFVQNAAGAILSPFDSWLVLRGTKTLPLRMGQHNANGLALAEFLAAHPKVRQVHLSRACRRIRSTIWRSVRCAASAGCSRSTSASLEAARRLLNSVRLMSLAESLGGVETLISHPATMTHASVPAERRAGARYHRRPGPHLGGHRGHRGSEGRP